MRGHEVYLHIKRRRWLSVDTGKVVYRDWSLVAKGTRITSDFAAFFKSNQPIPRHIVCKLSFPFTVLVEENYNVTTWIN
ncbi:ISAon1 family transposase N-terminal region protein [Desertivirga xinjiangensis]|uniref:ISAon1 family transposase N-terminal region protein n=1 Tax=Desertivirga xinjiangensis TaxID=539206 RepID=UPI003F70BDD8